ncbi:MAG: hypothetical protein NC099_02740 [Corallococcus sp.]|nr:MBOAT family protein [Bacillota bacterium]MCM1533549.1 hypothetical protein [Corallococcus sp.]
MDESIFSLLFNRFPKSVSFFSVTFAVFCCVSLIIYWALPSRHRYKALLVSSVVFYLFFPWWFALFLLFSTVTSYFIARAITKIDRSQKVYLENNKDLTSDEKKAFKAKNKKKKKGLMIVGILSVLILLVVMKYTDFIIDNINGISSWFGANKIEHLNLILPLGISFYTFQIIGYLADVYWSKYEAESNFLRYCLFIVFFPKIMQGPIIRYNEMKDELFADKKFDYTTFTDGLKRLAYGFFKKIVIADCLSVFVNWAFDNVAGLSGSTAFCALIAYMIQDYCDFSGYMDITIGIAMCFGIKMPENFCRPYFARTIPEYWRRWHITLGTWFKDYIFYPISMSKFSRKLGGVSKKIFGPSGKVVPAIFGLVIVWFSTGLWHGASWNYVLWGMYYGLIIILGIAFEPLFAKIKAKLHIDTERPAFRIFQHVRTILLLMIGRVLFMSNSVPDAIMFIGRIFTSWNNFDCSVIGNEVSLCVSMGMFAIVLVVDIIQERRPDNSFCDKLAKRRLPVRWSMYLLLIAVIIVFGFYGTGLPVVEFGYVHF